jgi:hypothetical protein
MVNEFDVVEWQKEKAEIDNRDRASDVTEIHVAEHI